MRVIFSTDQVYLHGGIERVMALKANYIAALPGMEVHIVTTEQQGHQPCFELDSRIQLHDLSINYDRSKSYFSFSNIKKAFGHYRKLKHTFKVLQPDVVIVCNYAFDFFFMPFLYSRAAKVKEFHSSRYFEQQARQNTKSFLRKILYKLTDYIEGKYDAIIALNKDEKQYYNANNVVVIPNPIAIPDQLPVVHKKTWAIAAGRIAPVKGFQYLIEAWGKVHQVLPGWELHIYGDSYLDTQQKLASQVQQAGLDDVVLFKGVASDMTSIFPEYSMYVMSSETECFPMVLLESLAVGLPIVSFDSPNGPRNIIVNKEDGLLAIYKNIDDLAEKIIFLAQNPQIGAQMGQKARENVQRFELGRVMDLWLNLFDRIIKK
ncbi:glycosyltransferase [Edaphocola flava]|uniref:glycosyltransferase n=1 Tax=Edaphocola flava TaxID=2499629 RepID=UPI00100AE80A|nr:glycosyltransferase [Edaphocola flava]